MTSASTTSIVRIVGLIATALGVLTVLTIAFIDGPAPSSLFRSMVAVHDAMVPGLDRPEPPLEAAPRLVSSIEVHHEGTDMSSQLIRWRRHWFSIHRVAGQPDPPPQARVARPGEPMMVAFDVGDLTLVTWTSGRGTVAVASSAAEPDLVALAELVERGAPLKP